LTSDTFWLEMCSLILFKFYSVSVDSSLQPIRTIVRLKIWIWLGREVTICAGFLLPVYICIFLKDPIIIFVSVPKQDMAVIFIVFEESMWILVLPILVKFLTIFLFIIIPAHTGFFPVHVPSLLHIEVMLPSVSL